MVLKANILYNMALAYQCLCHSCATAVALQIYHAAVLVLRDVPVATDDSLALLLAASNDMALLFETCVYSHLPGFDLWCGHLRAPLIPNEY